MLGSALMLALGVAVLVPVRLSGHAVSFGFAVFIGIWLVAAACAMHLGAITDTLLRSRQGAVRFGVRLAGWIGIGAGTAWVIGRAPGDEVLFSLLTVPSALGVAGLVVARRSPWPALPFLFLTAVMVGVLGQIWVERH